MRTATWPAFLPQAIRLWMGESSPRSGSIRPLPLRRTGPSVSSASSSATARRRMRSCATVSHLSPAADASCGSVHIDRRINSEHVLCRDQDVAGVRARRHRFTVEHLQSQRQDLAAVAIEKIRYRAKHNAVAVIRMNHLIGTGAAVNRGVAALADNHAVAHPAPGLGGGLCRQRRRIIERCDQHLRPALLRKQAAQLRLRLEKVTAAVELDGRYIWKMPTQALGDPGDARLDGVRGILDGSQN